MQIMAQKSASAVGIVRHQPAASTSAVEESTKRKIADTSADSDDAVAAAKAVAAKLMADKTAPDGSKKGDLSSFGLDRLWKKVDIASETCLLPQEKLEQPTPSSKEGVSVELEQEVRFLGCELIQSASVLLKLPQVAAATGQILYQRYFYSKSLVRNNFEHVAMACVSLASKIEEAPRRPRDVINVFHHLKQMAKIQHNHSDKKPQPMVLDQNYVSLKNHVIKAERRVLNTLGFCVHVRHPHKLIYTYLQALSAMDNHDLIQRSWSLMNDGLRVDIFVRFPPETIACACIFLAARYAKTPLPMSPQPWWELFDASTEDVMHIATILTRLYTRTKSPSWFRIERRVNELKALQTARSFESAAAKQQLKEKEEAEKDASKETDNDKATAKDDHDRRRDRPSTKRPRDEKSRSPPVDKQRGRNAVSSRSRSPTGRSSKAARYTSPPHSHRNRHRHRRDVDRYASSSARASAAANGSVSTNRGKKSARDGGSKQQRRSADERSSTGDSSSSADDEERQTKQRHPHRGAKQPPKLPKRYQTDEAKVRGSKRADGPKQARPRQPVLPPSPSPPGRQPARRASPPAAYSSSAGNVPIVVVGASAKIRERGREREEEVYAALGRKRQTADTKLATVGGRRIARLSPSPVRR